MDTSMVDIDNQPEVIVKTPMKPALSSGSLPNAVGIVEVSAEQPIMVQPSEPLVNEIAPVVEVAAVQAPVVEVAAVQAPLAPAAGIIQPSAEVEGIKDAPKEPQPMQPEDVIRYGVPNESKPRKCQGTEIDPNAPNCGGYICNTIISCLV